MSLTINGTLQNTFSIDGVSLDNLYIDGVLVFTSGPPTLSMTITSPAEPYYYSNGSISYRDNGDGTWAVYSYDNIEWLSPLADRAALYTAITIHDVSTLTSWDRMFSYLENVSGLDLSGMDPTGILDMSSMFLNSSGLQCISNIDTTGATDKADMFTGTSMLYPDATDIADITDGNGANWVNEYSCPQGDSRYAIIKSGNDYCEYPDGSPTGCTTDAIFDASNPQNIPNPTYSWVVTGATLASGQGTETITVSTPIGLTSVDYTVTLTVTDEYGVATIVENTTAVKVVAPIRITGISQDISGSCDPI